MGDEARDEACRRTTADRAGVRIFEPARDLAFALEPAVDSSSTSGAAALPGPGESRKLPDPDNIVFDNAGWLDAMHVIGFGQEIGERSQGYIQDINGGPPRRFTPEGATVKALKWWTLPISPDGTRVVAMNDRDAAEIYPVNGGARLRHLSGMSAACSPACARRHVAFA